MPKVLIIHVCEDCPHFHADATNVAWGTTKLQNHFWQQSRQGKTCACLQLNRAMTPEEAQTAVLPDCPLPDAN